MCVVVALLVLVAAVVITLGKLSDKPVFLFGKSILWVETGSMEPSIPAQSYVLVQKTDGKNLSVGDVITYVCRDSSEPVYGKLVTHRITAYAEGGYVTTGDAVGTRDRLDVPYQDVVAVYSKNLPFLTFFGRIFSGWLGFIVLGVLFFVTVSIYLTDIVKTLSGEDDETVAQQKQAEIQRRIDAEVARLMAEGDQGDDSQRKDE